MVLWFFFAVWLIVCLPMVIRPWVAIRVQRRLARVANAVRERSAAKGVYDPETGYEIAGKILSFTAIATLLISGDKFLMQPEEGPKTNRIKTFVEYNGWFSAYHQAVIGCMVISEYLGNPWRIWMWPDVIYFVKLIVCRSNPDGSLRMPTIPTRSIEDLGIHCRI